MSINIKIATVRRCDEQLTDAGLPTYSELLRALREAGGKFETDGQAKNNQAISRA